MRVQSGREPFALIGEVGCANVSTRLVAGRAGVNNALINYHVRTKDALLRTAAATGVAELVGPALERMLAAADIGWGMADTLRFLAGGLTAPQARTLLSSRCGPSTTARSGRC